jgi:cytochrome P450
MAMKVYSRIRLLYAVGAATTSDGLSSLLTHLLFRPKLVERCRADPDRIPLVVRESLRYEPPVANLPRLAPAGTDPGGDAGELSESTLVLCSLASASRDETVFDHPHEFDIDRTEADILTFGFGSKFCPGSHLTRQQMACAVAVLLERLANIEVIDADEPCGGVLRRWERLVARWRPA